MRKYQCMGNHITLIPDLRTESLPFWLGEAERASKLQSEMRAISDLTRGYGVKTVARPNSIMVDATSMCGACMVSVNIDGKMVRKHACVDGSEIDAYIIDRDKFLLRFGQFKKQEMESRERNHLA